ncbi:MAG: ribosome biogenesis/translation initiation ATPase RLI [Nanoarchaeota archaeon]|nr:ribosome biogenesis/translation initiation ATPase RLI [Nanoarchaeota archaeon]MBU4123928.1 ribosome biogenesis/translation initiation ATPase RLI [Nanoarchaeota archaeon]
MRIAGVNKKTCKSNKCTLECINVCPINRTGKKCVLLGDDKFAKIDEELCIGCGICQKKCPYKSIQIVNTPEQLKEIPMHRFGKNDFVLFRLPFPVKGEVIGLLGPNGVGKTTALNILSGNLKPNLGKDEGNLKEVLKLFRGTELQKHLEMLMKGEIKSIIKPQQIDVMSKIDLTANELLNKYNERGNKDELVKKLTLNACLDRKLSQLSGGELQRVAIAVAAEQKADIYYIDEPSSFLDVFQRLEVAKLIRELAKDSAVLVVEHDLATLDFIADRIHVFYGTPGVYGIVSKPYSTKNGINAFLDGYIREDNVRIREEAIDFSVAKSAADHDKEIYLEWSDIKKKLGSFSLTVDAGCVHKSEILGIFGANALGKTTFAKILAGEIKPDTGEMTKQAKISYKPQYISSDFKGTVSDLLSTTADVYSEEYKYDIIKPLSLERLMENDVKTLSGGELQRIAIALCLSKKADIYLLDEPSAFLDSEQRLEIGKMLRKFCERRECAAMVIDHDLLFLSYLSDRALLYLGETGISGYATQKELKEAFNEFLKKVDITFRKDPENARPRANKPGSQKDQEQKTSNIYFHV